MYTNRHLWSIALMLCTISVTAQKTPSKFKFGDIKPEDFATSVYPLDTSADAIYLFDVGSAEYEGNNKGDFSVISQKKTRIRLLDKKSFDDLATVIIYLYNSEDIQDKLTDFEAATYNLEDGKVVVTKIEKSSLFKEKDGNYQILKFTFPNIKAGSIIEYHYKVNSPYPYSIDPWNFQSSYPKLWSEYTVMVPQFYDFITFRQGYLPYAIDTSDAYRDNFLLRDNGDASSSAAPFSVTTEVFKHQWAIKDVPAIKKEVYTTTVDNYRSRISFQLSALKFPDAPVRPYLQDWKGMVEELMKRDDFGENLSHDFSWLKDDIKLADATNGKTLDNASNLYKFVQKNYTCIDDDGIYLSQALKKTWQSKKGNSTDINMLLIAMFRSLGFNADPVILSKRDHGKTYDLYPIMSKFNYTIARVTVGDDYYLLDASDKNLGFGILGDECYNGNARVVAPMPVLVNLSADSLKEASITFVSLMNDSTNNMSGLYSSQLGQIQSLNVRRAFNKMNKDDFFKEVLKDYSDGVTISNTTIDSLEIPTEPITIKFELSTKMEEDIIYFNPMMGEEQKENPFVAAERFYPVEMPYTTDETYICNMEIPQGYKVDEIPKSARINFNENEGSFEYIIAEGGGRIQLRCRLKINKATFDPEDYETLRDFYSFIVEKEGEQIVFKKIQ